MRHKVVWVKCKTDFLPTLEWIPVYWPAHSDPEIGLVASFRHCHIAWNRIRERPILQGTNLETFHGAGFPIFEAQIKQVDYNKASPVVSEPYAYRLPAKTILGIWGKR